MRNLIIFFSASLVYLAAALGLNIENTLMNVGNHHIPYHEITCSKKTQLICLQLCSSPERCYQAQPLCINCAGTTWMLIRDVLLNSHLFLEKSEAVIPETIATSISKSHHIFLDASSLFNFFGPLQSSTIQLQLNSLCPNQESAQIIVELSEHYIPSKIKFLSCKISADSAQFYELKKAKPQNKSLKERLP